MTTYRSKRCTSGPIPGVGGANQEVVAYEKYLLPSATLNDLHYLIPIPKGCLLVSVLMWCDDIDSNGSPAVTLDLGDSSSATLFYSASTVGQAGTVGSIVYPVKAYAARDDIICKIHAASATFASGYVYCVAKFVLDAHPTLG